MPAQAESAAQPKKRLAAAVAIFAERRTASMLALGFAAGLPILLVFEILSAWFRDSGLSLEVIGYFSLATLLYSLKFLWAPVIDRSEVPFLTARLGHRRSWMLLCQLFIIAGLLLLAASDPLSQLGVMAVLAFSVAFASATQDIVIDAWRIEAAEPSRQGVMAASYQWGYQAAVVTAGVSTLLLAQGFSWNFSYAAMATLMGMGVLATLAAPREAEHKIRPIPDAGSAASPVLVAIEWAARLLLLALGALLAGSGLTGNPLALSAVATWIAGADAGGGFVVMWRSAVGAS